MKLRRQRDGTRRFALPKLQNQNDNCGLKTALALRLSNN
jgi:hypothetical protein